MKLIEIQDMNEIGHRYVVLLSLDTHRQLISKISYAAIAHAGHPQMFAQSCGTPYVIVVQGNDEINRTRTSEEADATNHVIHLR